MATLYTKREFVPRHSSSLRGMARAKREMAERIELAEEIVHEDEPSDEELEWLHNWRELQSNVS